MKEEAVSVQCESRVVAGETSSFVECLINGDVVDKRLTRFLSFVRAQSVGLFRQLVRERRCVQNVATRAC